MGTCGKNCYGKKLEDLDAVMKESLPKMLLKFLLSLVRCANSNSLRNALANWNGYNIFIASKVRKDYKEVATSGSRFDTSDALNFDDDDLNRWTDEFNTLICNGGGSNIIDLDLKYNGDGKNSKPLWPGNMTDDEKDQIRDKIDKNNGYLDNVVGGGNSADGGLNNGDGSGWGNENSGGGNSNTGDGSGGNGSDSGGNGSGDGSNGGNGSGNGSDSTGGNGGSTGNSGNSNGGGNPNNNTGIDKDKYDQDGGDSSNIGDIFDNTGNPVIRIPVEDLDNLNDDKSKLYTCFEFDFKLENYMYINTKTTPLVTAAKVANLKRMHYEILTPIYNYYFSSVKPSCQLKITFGLGSVTDTVKIPTGSSFSRHIQGMAVDFTISGVDPSQFMKDVQEGNLNITFGILSPTNNLHITIPYDYEGYEITNVVINSPYKKKNSLEIQFI